MKRFAPNPYPSVSSEAAAHSAAMLVLRCKICNYDRCLQCFPKQKCQKKPEDHDVLSIEWPESSWHCQLCHREGPGNTRGGKKVIACLTCKDCVLLDDISYYVCAKCWMDDGTTSVDIPKQTNVALMASHANPSPPPQEDYRSRITAMYQKYAPEKLATLDTTLEKYNGAEVQLIVALVMKYGPEPVSAGASNTEGVNPPLHPQEDATTLVAYRKQLEDFYQQNNLREKLHLVDKLLHFFQGL